MELDECIKGRRSIRAYKSDSIPKDKIEAILEAGVWAPTGMNKQPWKFIIIENKETIKFISDESKKIIAQVMPQMKSWYDTPEDVVCYNAPVLILICTKIDKEGGDINLLDSVLASQNMFLKAHELGIGSCYMGFVSLLAKKPEILKKVGVPDGYEVQVPLILGYPKSKSPKGKRNSPEILKWIK